MKQKKRWLIVKIFWISELIDQEPAELSERQKMVYLNVFECFVMNRLETVLGDEPLVFDNNKTMISIGSDDDNDFVFKEKLFSGKHCKFTRYFVWSLLFIEHDT